MAGGRNEQERLRKALAGRRRELELARKAAAEAAPALKAAKEARLALQATHLAGVTPTSLYADSIRRAVEPLGPVMNSRRLVNPWRGLAPLDPALFAAPKIFENLIAPARMAERLREQLSFPTRIVSESILKQFSGIFDAVSLAQRMSEQLAEPLRLLREAFEGYEEDEARLLGELVPKGWLISPSMSIALVRRLARALEDHTPEEVEEALVGYFDADTCSEIVSALFTVPAFERRRPLLEDALEAHMNGKFTLSIPVWLLSIDGIAHEELGVPRIFATIQRKDGSHVRVVLESEHPSDTMLEALIDVLQQSGVSSRPGEQRVPNRNLILHGGDPDYATEKTSIQLILVLEVLHYFLGSETPAPRPGAAARATRDPAGR